MKLTWQILGVPEGHYCLGFILYGASSGTEITYLKYSITYPIQWRSLALGEKSFALPPNLKRAGPHGHSL